MRCRLVHLPAWSVRAVDPDYGEPDDRVGLADGFPFLLISEGSSQSSTRRLEHALGMDRFRPNLVVGAASPSPKTIGDGSASVP